jgi:hypothetical protein
MSQFRDFTESKNFPPFSSFEMEDDLVYIEIDTTSEILAGPFDTYQDAEMYAEDKDWLDGTVNFTSGKDYMAARTSPVCFQAIDVD